MNLPDPETQHSLNRFAWQLACLVGTLATSSPAATTGDDVVQGTALGDLIYLDLGNDEADGLGGNDFIFGDSGSDTLIGGNGDDHLIGGSFLSRTDTHGNIFRGGAGNDQLYGGALGDDYYYDSGDGLDLIREFGKGAAGTDRLFFGTGIGVAGITYARERGDLILELGGSDIIRIESWFGAADDTFRIDELHFTGGDSIAGSTLSFEGTSWLGTSNADTYTAPTATAYWIQGKAGNDTLTGAGGADVLLGGSGTDTLSGGDSGDGLYGDEDADILHGGNGNDDLYGGEGNDTLNGDNGDDLLVGGPGNDSLNGGNGNDTYRWEPGDGDDQLADAFSEYNVENRLTFPPGVLPAQVEMVPASPALKFVVKDTAGQPIGSANIASWYSLVTGNIRHHTTWRIMFADGTLWDGRNMATPGSDTLEGTNGPDIFYGGAGNDNLYGGVGDDQLFGEDGDDVLAGWTGIDLLYGGAGNDTLYGEAGDDTLSGEAGNDTLYGGAGLDVYKWNLGDGNDTANDSDTAAGSVSRLEFGAGILPTDIVMEPVPSTTDLKFTVMSGGVPAGSVRVSTWYQTFGGVRYHTTWRIAFANGVVWDGRYLGTPGNDTLDGTNGADIFYGGAGNDNLYGGVGDDQLFGEDGNDVLAGWTGNDLLQGGTGNDTLYGEAGNDIYRWNLGDGDDVAIDSDTAAGVENRLEFGAGIVPSDIVIEPVSGSNDLKFTVTSAGLPVGSVKIVNWYHTVGGVRLHTLWRIAFANGTVWDGRYLGTPGNDLLAGTAGADTLSGAAGNDSLYAEAGDDFVFGNDGDDLLAGWTGNDTLEGGSGADTLYGDAGNDILSGGAGNDTLNGGAGLDIFRWSLGDGDDIAVDNDVAAGSESKVEFGAGIVPSDIVMEPVSGTYDFKLKVMSGGVSVGSVKITSWFQTFSGVRLHTNWRIIFANGTVWDGRYLGTPGNDVLAGTTGPDSLSGGAGNDVLGGDTGDDQLYGDDGDDTLYGWQGNDLLWGGNGNDTLNGEAGNDTLAGEVGNDTLYGGAGLDIYRWNLGDGDDIASDSDTTTGVESRIEFGTGIVPSDIVIEPVSGTYDLKLKVMAGGLPVGSMRVANWFAVYSGIRHHTLWRIAFNNGTVWDGRYLATPGDDTLVGTTGADNLSGAAGNDTLLGDTGDDQLFGDDGNDTLYGWNGNDILSGGTGNDTLNGEAGNDTLSGGIGNDTLNGGAGLDTYRWNLGDGDDFVFDSDTSAGSESRLELGSGISPSDILLETVPSSADLKLTVMSGGQPVGSVRISSWYAVFSGVRHHTLWRIAFDNGTVWDGRYLTTSGSDTLTGTTGVDNLAGGLGNDTFYGDAGNDILLGDDGDDTLYGGNGNDTLHGGPGNDKLYGEADEDDLRGGEGDDILDGGTGNDYLFGAAGNDSLSGGNGDDILEGGPGNDTLNGGAGLDTYLWNLGEDNNPSDGDDSAYDSDTVAGSESWLEFGEGILPSDIVIETVPGSADIKFKVKSFDIVVGSMRIGSWYTVNNGVGYNTTWRIKFQNGTTWDGRYLTTPGNDMLAGSSAADTLDGGAGNDTVNGNDGDDILSGGSGIDLIDGGNGNDILVGGSGFDVVSGGNGNDTYRWSIGDGDDQIADSYATSSIGALNRLEFGPDILPSQVSLEPSGAHLLVTVRDSVGKVLGSVTILWWYYPVSGSICHRESWKIVFANGTEWDGRIQATPGDDNFTGTSGTDTFSGGAGNDTANGAAGNDTLNGGTGVDTLIGGDGDDTLRGDDGNDTLYGGTGNDDLTGGLGSDQLLGEDGNDTLWGGPGNDVLYGGNGSDIYKWSPGDGDDVLSDNVADTVSHNILAFGSSISLGQLDFARQSYSDLIVTVPPTDGAPASSLKIAFWAATQGSVYHLSTWSLDLPGVGQFRFANPATVNNDVATGTSNADLLVGLAGADSLSGAAGNDLLHGGAGNDSLQGDLGDDYLVGGLGDDLLSGGEGSDRYIIEAGHGADEIVESSTAAPEEADEIQFGPGILSHSVSVTRDGNDLRIDYGNSAGSLKIRDWFATTTRDAAVAWIRFHDGSAWDTEFIESRVDAGPGSGTANPVSPLDVETVTTALDAHTPAATSGLEVLTPLQ